MFELMDSVAQDAVIKVVGVGGGGGNAVTHMMSTGIEGVDFICANTDAQALTKISGATSLQIGTNITKGLGAGANPDVGRQAALEDRERIQEIIMGADMIFVTAGMGGGTGTGAAPVVAQIARDMGILCVGVVTKPFVFEGANRMKIAQQGIQELSQHVDSLITIPNDKLLSVYGREFDLMNAFNGANDVLHNAVQGITELITHPGVINVDFADVRTVMSQNGMGMMGSGIACGESRAAEAAEAAVASPLLEDVNISGARGILVNVTGTNLTLGEFEDIGAIISSFASDEAIVVMGTAIDPELEDQLRVTVVATGLGQAPAGMSKDPMKIVKRTTTGDVDYGDYDKPTIQRKKAVGDGLSGSLDDEMLDIPAFLRRQAD
ncbi:MAG: cell division protein FtsZ [endosymbiont of Galathealinum brachiosum]|uniref:Cell division protein FtsZ n=1 Tax=endosymbiont of Galathealinum brachiosum TaxID=2200906 RepID=A0A370D8T9_9GAMM|nr:MAG: cell division protein FtsZ [endosymbiont of Galathealinum brachiosum]